MPELDYLDHGRVILPTNADPAIVCVEGYERFYLGLDLGRSDPTALVLLRDRQLPEWPPPCARSSGYGHPRSSMRTTSERRPIRTSRTIWPSYISKSDLIGRTQLCVDATDLGAPFCDVLTEGGIDHLAITMTAGASWTRRGHRVTVSKNLLLETLASGFETRALAITHDLPLKAELIIETASFELATTQAGNFVLQAGGKGHHADMAVALALAWFASSCLVGRVVDEVRLTNWY